MSPEHFEIRDACPACAGPRRREIYRLSYEGPEMTGYLESFYGSQGRYEPGYLVGAAYVLDLCEDCGVIYQEQVPDDRLLHRLYERWIEPEQALELYRRTRGLGSVVGAARYLADFHRHLGARPYQLEVLDFGMGWGQWCHLARGFGCDVVGIELSESRIRHAEAEGLRVLGWDEVEARTFDVIHAEQVFEHLTEPLATLERLTRRLRPGGLFYLAVPNGAGMLETLKSPDWTATKGSARSLNPVAPLEHLNCFDRRSLLRMAARAGLEPVTELPPARDLSLPRRLERLLQHLYYRLRGRSETQLLLRKPISIPVTL